MDFNDPKRPIDSLNKLLFNINYAANECAPILAIPQMIPEEYIPNLYTTGDYYLAPTLGEGFGFPIAESMACGVPPIVSNCSAPSEYVDDESGYLIHLNETQPIQEVSDESLLLRDRMYKGRFIYDLSLDSFSKALTTAYNESDEDRLIKGNNARQTIIDRFSLEPLTLTIKNILEDK